MVPPTWSFYHVIQKFSYETPFATMSFKIMTKAFVQREWCVRTTDLTFLSYLLIFKIICYSNLHRKIFFFQRRIHSSFQFPHFFCKYYLFSPTATAFIPHSKFWYLPMSYFSCVTAPYVHKESYPYWWSRLAQLFFISIYFVSWRLYVYFRRIIYVIKFIPCIRCRCYCTLFMWLFQNFKLSNGVIEKNLLFCLSKYPSSTCISYELLIFYYPDVLSHI